MPSIGLVANVYNEARALPGWLETHLPIFDDVRILHAGPQGASSNDGTIELLEKWRVPIEYCAIDEGFGAVRTRAIDMSPCDWVMILDADERFYGCLELLTCTGKGTPQEEVDQILQSYDFRDLKHVLPNWENMDRLGADLQVNVIGPYSQIGRLRSILERVAHGGENVITTVRRHWHDFTMRRPTQSWNSHPDYQARIIKRNSGVRYGTDTRMHEQLRGMMNIFFADGPCALYFDHFHLTFKRMEQQQRSHDIAIYDAIHAGTTPPKWDAFKQTRGY